MTQREMLETLDASWQMLDGAVAGLGEADHTEPGVVGAWAIKDLPRLERQPSPQGRRRPLLVGVAANLTADLVAASRPVYGRPKGYT